MRPKIIFFITVLFATARLYGQTFPVVITDTYQNAGSGPLNLHIGSVGATNPTTFQVNKKLVATAVVSGSGGTGSWWQVEMPGTNSSVKAYCAAGGIYTNPICNSQYITVKLTSVNISKTAGSTTYVTISYIRRSTAD